MNTAKRVLQVLNEAPARVRADEVLSSKPEDSLTAAEFNKLRGAGMSGEKITEAKAYKYRGGGDLREGRYRTVKKVQTGTRLIPGKPNPSCPQCGGTGYTSKQRRGFPFPLGKFSSLCSCTAGKQVPVYKYVEIDED
jgi:hypothetical protein